MPKSLRSPLNAGDLDFLQALAIKTNAMVEREGTAPFYLAGDGGGDDQPNGWLFLAWPAMYRPSALMAEHLFNEVARAAYDYLGAEMELTETESEDA